MPICKSINKQINRGFLHADFFPGSLKVSDCTQKHSLYVNICICTANKTSFLWETRTNILAYFSRLLRTAGLLCISVISIPSLGLLKEIKKKKKPKQNLNVFRIQWHWEFNPELCITLSIKTLVLPFLRFFPRNLQHIKGEHGLYNFCDCGSFHCPPAFGRNSSNIPFWLAYVSPISARIDYSAQCILWASRHVLPEPENQRMQRTNLLLHYM